MGKGHRARRKEKQLNRLEKKNQRDADIKEGKMVPIRPHREWETIVKENPGFETYYRAQELVKSEEEFQEFMATLRSPLQASFRITSYFGGQSAALKRIVSSSEFNQLMVVEDKDVSGDTNGSKQEDKNGVEKKEKTALSCLPWYPNSLAFQLNMSRIEIRKSEALQRLHNFLLSETEAGYISRQESVSMIPPLVLDVKPHHKILDMCAAPGSKTAQLIELLHDSKDGSTEGVVVANDVDNKRCYMLVHQAKRLHSPSCIITNHDASLYPTMFETTESGERKEIKFDRILCDVPCSGDGTLRKNTEVWKSWNVANANNFHGLQLKIAKRGMELLAKDGLMAYSTCSFNPQEDEAVVSSLIQQSKGGIELVDVTHSIPNLKFIPGLETWKVMTRNLKVIDSVKDLDEKQATRFRESMFPPDKETASKMNLKRCLRILPHLQDTGGFFIAVLRKKVDQLAWEQPPTKDIPVEAMEEETVVVKEDPEDTQSEPATKKTKYVKKKVEKKNKGFKEEPFLFFTKDAPEWPAMKEFYRINSSFPYGQLMCRCIGGSRRNIYFLTKAAKMIISENEDHVRFINAGVRLFNKNTEKDFDCDYRLTQDGLPSVFPYVDPESLILLSFEDMKNIISEDNFPIEKLSESVRSKIEPLPLGSCILLFKTMVDDTEITVPMCGWRGKASLRPYIVKHERIHYLRICGVDTFELETDMRKQFEDREERKAERLQKELDLRKQAQELLEPRNGSAFVVGKEAGDSVIENVKE